ncbi:MAG: lipopolysaccharide biosynthesis protein [Gemmatimonadota bacterium]
MTAADTSRDTADMARGAMANFGGMVFRLLSVVFLVVVAQLFGAEMTGLYLVSLAAVDTAYNLAALGVDRSVLTRAARHHAVGDLPGLHAEVARALWIGTGGAIALMALLLVLAGPVAEQVFAKPPLAGPLRVMAIALPFWGVAAVLLGATRALRLMRYQILAKNVVEPVIRLAVALTAWWTAAGLVGLAAAVPLAALAGAVAATIFFGRVLSLPMLGQALRSTTGLGEALRFTAPIGLNDLVNQLIRRADLLLVGRYLPPALVGAYGAAAEAVSPVKLIRQGFDPIVLPILAGAREARDHTRMAMHFRDVTRWILILDLAVLGVVVLASGSIMGIFGPEFGAGAVALAVLATATVLNGVLGVSELFLLIDRPWVNLANAVATLAIQATLLVVLVPSHGLAGAALATLIAAAVSNLVRLGLVAAWYRIHPFTRYHGRAVVAALGAMLLVVAVRGMLPSLPGPWNDMVVGAGFLMVYLAALRLAGLAPGDQDAASRWAGRVVREFRRG